MNPPARRRAAFAWLAVVCALVACRDRADRFRPLSLGNPAPPYAAPSLAGDTVSVASLRGQVVMLNVWATWCLPCLHEMPLLDSLSRDFSAQGLRVIGVSIDDEGSDDRVKAFRDEHGISFTLLRDPEKTVTQTFQTRGVPETFLLDRGGKIVMHWIGGVDASAASVRAVVQKTLGRG